jgi:hypothetical protein
MKTKHTEKDAHIIPSRWTYALAKGYRKVTLWGANKNRQRAVVLTCTPTPTMSRREKYDEIAERLLRLGIKIVPYKPTAEESAQPEHPQP